MNQTDTAAQNRERLLALKATLQAAREHDCDQFTSGLLVAAMALVDALYQETQQ
jgi:hypothetical protein